VRVIKERECGIVRRVHLLDDDGERIVAVGRFLDHLAERACSPHTLCAYGYDLQQLFTFLAGEQLVWEAFGPADALRFLAFLKRIGKYVATGRVGAGAKLMHDYSITSCW
jgi:site-specific recombinase XerD